MQLFPEAVGRRLAAPNYVPCLAPLRVRILSLHLRRLPDLQSTIFRLRFRLQLVRQFLQVFLLLLDAAVAEPTHQLLLELLLEIIPRNLV